MIYSLRGKILLKFENFLVVESGGIGFRVYVLTKELKTKKIKDNASLFVYFYMREGVVELYGFSDLKELQFFELLNSVSGIGPKSAMAILEKGNIQTLGLAIKNNRIDFLTKASGIGKKTAERIVLELKNKINLEEKGGVNFDINLDVLEALIGLGYKKQEAQKAIDGLDDSLKSFEEKFKYALKILNKK